MQLPGKLFQITTFCPDDDEEDLSVTNHASLDAAIQAIRRAYEVTRPRSAGSNEEELSHEEDLRSTIKRLKDLQVCETMFVHTEEYVTELVRLQ